ncbi:Zn(2)-C6 fungal-type domain-containing protein [Fusarium falciforme]|uniref:Zn(2)-C6 fungal-type domain-containing protein n=1 Tax=Fusarium falciforme TaxID=195108 RepID=UPI00230062D5|nr:Zn(2)-C6 fungal-type domain-containing protein [Fusarium falciforme]WAO87008.1 Zn(2)-C6 fungal-type domain-containing protein [Fusarium falciforme]
MQSQPKRMRLGTKSCTECRRRKVRCIFPEGSDRCRQCKAHKAPCRPQQAPSSDSPSTSSLSPDYVQSNESAVEVLRLRECQRLGLPPDTSLGAIFTHVVGESVSSRSTSSDQDLDASVVLENAPLMKNLRETLPTQPSFEAELRPRPKDPFPNRSSMIYLPCAPTLVSIFEYTLQFWAIWPLAFTPTDTGERCFPDSVPMAVRFIQQSVISSNPGVVARALVWLSLCLQELPKDFNKDTPLSLPWKASKIIDYYLKEVDDLLQTHSSPVCNLEFIEALTLQYELFIFMGRPCSAWKSTRTALNNAMILGLHGLAPNGRKKEIWNALWVQDRHLSLFLGLPYAVPEHFIRLDRVDENDALERKILRKVGIISGHITDRNCHQLESSYSSTARIIEEMDQLKEMIPTEWWEPTEADITGYYGIDFTRRAIILFYYTTNKLLHLPYVRMAARDKRYDYSRTAAFESAEGMVRAYLNMRALGTAPMSCDFVDFMAFSGAAILAADLISKNSSRLAEEEERLWKLIMGLAKSMRDMTSVLDCVVAAQAAEVLENLHAARHGTFSGPENFEVTIPYFGRMRISRVEKPAPALPQNVVEFGTNVFNMHLPTNLQASCELTENWSSGWDFDYTYEWQDVFNFEQIGS